MRLCHVRRRRFAADGVVDDAEFGAAADEGVTETANGAVRWTKLLVPSMGSTTHSPSVCAYQRVICSARSFLRRAWGCRSIKGRAAAKAVGCVVGFAEHGAVLFAVRRGIQEVRHDFGLRDVPDDFLQSV